MSQALFALVVALHALATVIFVGYFVMLSLLCLPLLDRTDGRAVISEVSHRSRPWLYASLVVLALSGIYLMLVDPDYLGFMDLGNGWGVLMFVKHLLIAGLIVGGFWFNAIQRVGPTLRANHGAEAAAAGFRLYARLMAAGGVGVLLLTALAQAL